MSLNFSSYGYCPKCGAEVTIRERRMNGNDECANGHKYPMRETLFKPKETKTETKEGPNE